VFYFARSTVRKTHREYLYDGKPIEFTRLFGTGARTTWDGAMAGRFEISSRPLFDKKPRVSAARKHNKSVREQTQRQGSLPVASIHPIPAYCRPHFGRVHDRFFDRRFIAYRARTRRAASS